MHSLLSYVPMDYLLSFGFNYAETSAITSTKNGKLCSIHAAYYAPANTQILIGYIDSHKREWFFDTIQNMSDEEMQGKRHEELYSHITNLPVRKNRIAGRDLLRKFRELEQYTQTSTKLTKSQDPLKRHCCGED